MEDEAINISTILLETVGSDGEDSDPDRPTKRENEKGIAKRMRKIPIAFMNDGDNGDSQNSDLATSYS